MVTSVTEYAFVMATYDERSAYSTTLGGALGGSVPRARRRHRRALRRSSHSGGRARRLGADADRRDEPAIPPTSRPTTRPTASAGTGTPDGSARPRRTNCCATAEEQLRLDGDLGAYQERVDQAAALVGAGAQTCSAPTRRRRRSRRSARRQCRPSCAGRRPSGPTARSRRGRRSCSARRARSSRKAIW